MCDPTDFYFGAICGGVIVAVVLHFKAFYQFTRSLAPPSPPTPDWVKRWIEKVGLKDDWKR